MFRTVAQFKDDLERLYKDGFRPATVSDYLDDKFQIGAGAMPVVFTFDDSNPSQIQLNPDGSLKPDCALGIWEAFAKVHPDFPIRATFYVLPNSLWGKRAEVEQKLTLLRSLGCELGNHTVTHPILRKLTDEKVKEEIGVAMEDLIKLKEPMPVSLALPFGVSPKNKSLLTGFDWHGAHIAPKAVMLVGAEPAPAVTDPKFNKYAIPRVQACAGPSGMEDWLQKIEAAKVKMYVQ